MPFPALRWEPPTESTNPVRWKRFKVLEIAQSLMAAALQGGQALAPQEAVKLAAGLYDSCRETYTAAEKQWELRMQELEKKRKERLEKLEEERRELMKKVSQDTSAGNCNSASAIDGAFDEAEQKLADLAKEDAGT
jgi:plasmid maintenance system antidote protein VapI